MNEPLFQHIYLKDEESYNIIKVDRPYFIVPWHLHPEVELMNITKGEGSRFVGDSIENYDAGDLVLVGPNLPHCWKSGSSHYQPESGQRAKARVILFRQECFGERFFSISELKIIKEMFLKAERGICFSGRIKNVIADKIAKAYSQKGVKRFISFIEILYELAECRDYKLLSSSYHKSNIYASDMQRLNKVFDFLMLNYSKQISLEDIAAVAFMSPTAFCRYFKMHTNKTVFNFLNELRIGYAKKMLIENNINISEIHYLSGFQSSSNFYEQFKKIAGHSPLQFRKQHEKNITQQYNFK